MLAMRMDQLNPDAAMIVRAVHAKIASRSRWRRTRRRRLVRRIQQQSERGGSDNLSGKAKLCILHGLSEYYFCGRAHVKTINIHLFLIVIGRYEHQTLIHSNVYVFEMNETRARQAFRMWLDMRVCG